MRTRQGWQRIGYWAAAAGLVAFAAYLRFRDLDAFSLTLDEITLVDFSKSIFVSGYPYIYVGSMEVPLATYELVPYFIALSTHLFGMSDFNVRFPAAIFGTATTYLILSSGWKWFDWRVGILAAILYCVSPWAIYWAQNSFHPSQTQFFVLLTAIQIQRILSSDKIAGKNCYTAALFFCCAYLSWEGTGFLLVILSILALFTRWGKWDWLTYRHIWGASAMIITVVVTQMSRRLYLSVDYLMVGSGKSDVSMPQMVFTKDFYSPYYYLTNFFGMETHLVLTTMFLLGTFFVLKHWNFRFVYVFTLVGVAAMTNLLGYYNAHYVYYLLPIFVIAAAAATVLLLDRLTTKTTPPLLTPRLLNGPIVIATFAIVLFSSIPTFKLYKFSQGSEPARPVRVDARRGLAGIDYRGIAGTLKAEFRPGDIIVAASPSSLRQYTGMDGNYFLQSITDRKVILDPNATTPFYSDKFVGNPVLRSLEEFQDILNRHHRVWLYGAPWAGFREIIDEKLANYVETNMRLVAQSYDSRLYLWER